MVGGTTASDLATCELEVMKQKSKSNRKNNPNPKSKSFLRMGVRDRAWAARWNVLPTIRIGALREGIDIFAVVIDRMTGGYLFRVLKSHSL
jgi:hypothetical protein